MRDRREEWRKYEVDVEPLLSDLTTALEILKRIHASTSPKNDRHLRFAANISCTITYLEELAYVLKLR